MGTPSLPMLCKLDSIKWESINQEFNESGVTIFCCWDKTQFSDERVYFDLCVQRDTAHHGGGSMWTGVGGWPLLSHLPPESGGLGEGRGQGERGERPEPVYATLSSTFSDPLVLARLHPPISWRFYDLLTQYHQYSGTNCLNTSNVQTCEPMGRHLVRSMEMLNKFLNFRVVLRIESGVSPPLVSLSFIGSHSFLVFQSMNSLYMCCVKWHFIQVYMTDVQVSLCYI